MERKIFKSKVSRKQYKKFDFERVVIEKGDAGKNGAEKTRVVQ